MDDAGKPVKIAKPKYGLHSLRHAAASLWTQNGTNAKRIQTLMGHSSITPTMIVMAIGSPTTSPTKRLLRIFSSLAGKVTDAAPLFTKHLISLHPNGFVNRRSEVQSSQPAPAKSIT